MRESWGSTKPKGAMKVKAFQLVGLGGIPGPRTRAHHRPVSVITDEAEQERTCWDPKDGELCLSRSKPEETLVEDHSDSDVQIDRQTWV